MSDSKLTRKRIYEIIEAANGEDEPSRMYDIFMIICIFLSLLPMMQKSTDGFYYTTDKVTAFIFIIDYILRLITADYKLGKGKSSFVIYPFTFMAIVDLVSILPSISILPMFFKAFRSLRLLRALRVVRVIKAFRYSKNITIIMTVFRKQKDSLTVVFALAVGYILVSALIMFNIEPDTFNTYFDAIYWATVSLTTVGYGDIYATTVAGKIITMLTAVFGVAIVALPMGIITAGYMDALNEEK